MSKTYINIDGVVDGVSTINAAKTKVATVKGEVAAIRYQVDTRIRSRSNIDARFSMTAASIEMIQSELESIRNVVQNGANRYYQTECSLVNNGRIISGLLLPIASYYSDKSPDWMNKTVEGAAPGKEDGLATKILKDDWKIEGAVCSGAASASGTFLGVSASGKAEGDLIGGSVSTKSTATFDLKDSRDKNIALEKSIEAEGHLATGKLSGNYGILSGSVSGTVGAVGATGSVGATLYKDGKFAPSLSAKVEASASVAKGEAEVTAGSEEYNVHAKAEGSVLTAKAEAEGGIGKVTYKNGSGITQTGYGVAGEAGAEAYVAEGKVSGGVTILGVKFGVEVSGKAGGVGASAGGALTTGGVSGSVSAGLGLGAGVSFNVDWSGFSLW